MFPVGLGSFVGFWVGGLFFVWLVFLWVGSVCVVS